MITLTRTTADHILKLRHQVLRPGLPIAEVIFAEDQDQETRHYGAIHQHGEIICCATLIPSTWHGEPAWRLRAMATAPGWRNQGIGTGLIRYLLEDLQESNQARPIWSNARVSSARFYRELGWREVSEQFENGNAGLSVTMLKEEKTLAAGQVPGAGIGSRIRLR
ncbi:GNAT family N-acetyltransferase [Acaryochloris marina]|uniref:Acetyltransferase, gnat family n=1 Tax=Acaryochloris marina (strain MBIC 11017) TaxID=329726 RepID=A8ZQT4_ACAM1|nr:GNAT family N-acetyltransferase [Acaryochloris marina]ABW33370.1 acetyltransferase, gnat family [Acaryochloris marina MBIC11017]